MAAPVPRMAAPDAWLHATSGRRAWPPRSQARSRQPKGPTEDCERCGAVLSTGLDQSAVCPTGDPEHRRFESVIGESVPEAARASVSVRSDQYQSTARSRIAALDPPARVAHRPPRRRPGRVPTEPLHRSRRDHARRDVPEPAVVPTDADEDVCSDDRYRRSAAGHAGRHRGPTEDDGGRRERSVVPTDEREGARSTVVCERRSLCDETHDVVVRRSPPSAAVERTHVGVEHRGPASRQCSPQRREVTTITTTSMNEHDDRPCVGDGRRTDELRRRPARGDHREPR